MRRGPPELTRRSRAARQHRVGQRRRHGRRHGRRCCRQTRRCGRGRHPAAAAQRGVGRPRTPRPRSRSRMGGLSDRRLGVRRRGRRTRSDGAGRGRRRPAGLRPRPPKGLAESGGGTSPGSTWAASRRSGGEGLRPRAQRRMGGGEALQAASAAHHGDHAQLHVGRRRYVLGDGRHVGEARHGVLPPRGRGHGGRPPAIRGSPGAGSPNGASPRSPPKPPPPGSPGWRSAGRACAEARGRWFMRPRFLCDDRAF